MAKQHDTGLFSAVDAEGVRTCAVHRSLWVLPKGDVCEVDPHYHAEGLVEDLWSQAGFENVGFASLEDQLEYAYKRGAIRLIHDFDRSLGKPKRIWAAELDVRVPRWRERLRDAMMDLRLPQGTKVEIYDTATDRRVPALVTNPRTTTRKEKITCL
jgi:hypothetical protein